VIDAPSMQAFYVKKSRTLKYHSWHSDILQIPMLLPMYGSLRLHAADFRKE
jgi:hypothetical protein